MIQILIIALLVSAGFAIAILASGHDASSVEGAAANSASYRMMAPRREAAMPVAVELFTSQGCSSCPPADRLIASLVDDPGLVIITRPVTYWDRLGWRDTLGRQENTDLQRAYARNLERGGGRSYTPQAVVNGRVGLIGSRRNELRMAIAAAGSRRNGIAIGTEVMRDGSHIVRVSGAINGTAQVQLLALDSSETVAIGRGENGGRRVTYTNVLRGETRLGSWSGGARRFTVNADALNVAGADRHAVIVRQGAAGPILAVRYL